MKWVEGKREAYGGSGRRGERKDLFISFLDLRKTKDRADMGEI